MRDVLLVRTVDHRRGDGVDAGLQRALLGPGVDNIRAVVRLGAYEDEPDHGGIRHVAVGRRDKGRHAEDVGAGVEQRALRHLPATRGDVGGETQLWRTVSRDEVADVGAFVAYGQGLERFPCAVAALTLELQ